MPVCAVAFLLPVVVALPASAAGRNVQVRWRLTTDASVGGTGWFLDTLSVTDGYECCTPPPLRIESIILDGFSATLSWPAIPGRTYRLQRKPHIDAPWIDAMGDVTATGATASRTDPLDGASQRFYRVIRLP
jgi:hypothetical protein